MKTRLDEEKRTKRGHKQSESPILSPKDSKSPNAAAQELSHEDVVWPFYLCLDSNFAKTFMCSQCNQIPKQTHAFTSESQYIFCEYCIDKLIDTQTHCKIDNAPITHKHAAKVIDNLIKSLRIKCPHCKESQLQPFNIGNGQKSIELKVDDDDIDDEDDNQINIPPFPTNMMMNEGMDENQQQQQQMGIVGIVGGNKKDNIQYCEWEGTISELYAHLQYDCQFIKIHCPLYDLDATLCAVDTLYPHQLKQHLQQNVIVHWQHIVKEINELKSLQLSIILKQEHMRSGEASTASLNPNGSTPTANPEVDKLRAEHVSFMDKMESKLAELVKDNKMKDVLIQCQNTKLSMMQKEIVCFKKMMDEYHKREDNEQHNIRKRYHEYESDITSMFHHTNHSLGTQKMLEMQQMLLQTQNKIDAITSETKSKDHLIDTQNKSISSLQSQIATMNASANAAKLIQQPGAHTPHGMSYHIHSTNITPGWDPGHVANAPSPAAFEHISSSDPVLITLPKRYPSRPSSPPMHQSKSHDIRRGTHSGLYAAHNVYTHSPPYDRAHRTTTYGDGSHSTIGSKSMNCITLNESDKIYRSDSGGSAENDTYRHRYHHVPSLTKKKEKKRRYPDIPQNTRRIYENSAYDTKIRHKERKYDARLKRNEEHKARLMIYGVGYNEEGEIGLGHRRNLSSFTRLSFCDTMHITAIYYGSQSFFYLTASNELYCTGYNKYGQLGLGHTSEYIIKPTLNKYFKSEDREIDFISNSVCSYHTILKTKRGKLCGFGWNNNGQLGIGRKSFKESVPIELKAEIFNTNYIISISCGFHHTLFLTDHGDIICVGSNQYGQTGFGSNVTEVLSPSIVDIEDDIIGIQCGEYFSCCLDKNGNVLVMGRNDSAQLGLGDKVKNEECVYVPTVIEYFKQKGIVITSIKCGDYHTLCLDSKGCVFAFGNNEYGQIGAIESDSTTVNLPTKCKLPNNKKSKVIIEIDAGAYHSLLLSEDNEIYCFGNNDCQQCSTILNHKKISCPYWLKKNTEITCLDLTKTNNITQIIAGYDCSFLVVNEE